MIDIADLSYLENIKSELIVGGALLGITADASASGAEGLAETGTRVNIKNKPQVTIGKAEGTSLAIGDGAVADVSVLYAGWDKVKVKVRSHYGDNYALTTVKVKAIDHP
ncbi:hypothetical protein H6G33_29295 [Calothrix sp. FACHB-1219]|uniref:hypothetical protein n=1 Tax=unclassified Calothrix TaxID=2619626 RepID=UPI0016866BD3|nr:MULTISPECIES: hypothetical protein [unclassified Calothrix]MBD2206295.1 hypothetical protein [Calothrix sp. FACHB-168]MBD2221077.1 hypothetical protein [Calothrix sp. FACHB-1219]